MTHSRRECNEGENRMMMLLNKIFMDENNLEVLFLGGEKCQQGNTVFPRENSYICAIFHGKTVEKGEVNLKNRQKMFLNLKLSNVFLHLLDFAFKKSSTFPQKMPTILCLSPCIYRHFVAKKK